MREKKIKIRSEIDDETRKIIEKINETKEFIFRKGKQKIDQSLTRLTKRKERRLT